MWFYGRVHRGNGRSAWILRLAFTEHDFLIQLVMGMGKAAAL